MARGYGLTLSSKATPRENQAKTSEQESGASAEDDLPAQQEVAVASPPTLPSPDNLPSRSTSFVGRDIELGNIIQKLSQPNCKLLSLVGMGGVGKSRLSLQAAYKLREAEHFSDGIFYVNLDALTTPRLIPNTIADTLEFSLTGKDAELDQLGLYIGTKNMLLILDNFEHLIEGATLLCDLLQVCPNLKLLVTTREQLRLSEEWIFPVAGLVISSEDTPFSEAQNCDAIQLFFQRAIQVQPTFELTPENLPHILKLCGLVTGSPLALELAAAWVQIMSPEALVGEIELNLDALQASARDLLKRHESFRAVFEHSWKLLNLEEQTVLKKLAVFRGGFTREAAFKVVGAPLGVLASLVNKSLLRVLPSERYNRHALILQYTQEMLAQDATEHEHIQEQHFVYFLALAEKARPLLDGPDQETWLGRFEQDHDNFRMALIYAFAGDTPEKSLRLAGELWKFWSVCGHYSEGRDWLDKALARSGSFPTQARALALRGVGWLATVQADYQAANDYSTEGLAIYRRLNQPRNVATLLNSLAGIAYYLRDYSLAANYLEEVLAIYQTLEDKGGVASTLGNLGALAFEQGNPQKAHSLYEKTLQISQEIGDKRQTAFILVHLGEMAVKMKNHDLAHDVLEQGLRASKELNYRRSIAHAYEHLGNLAREEVDHSKARANYIQSLSLYRALGDQIGVVRTLEGIAYLSIQQRNWQRSACLFEVAGTLRKSTGTLRGLYEKREFEETCKELTTQLSEGNLCAAKDRGRNMSLEQAIAYALEPVAQESS